MMKPATVMLCATLVSSVAFAEGPSAQAGAASQQDTSVSANRSGASASHNGTTSADASRGPNSASVAQGTAMNAVLTRPVDSRKAKPGDPVSGRTTQDVRSGDQVVIKRGSTLVGHVTSAQSRDGAQHSSNGDAAGESTLGIVFDHAVLKDGRQVPLNAGIQALAAGEGAASSEMGGMGGGSSAGSSMAGSAMGAGRASGGLLGGGAVGGVANATAGVTGGATGALGSTVGGSAGLLSHSAGAVGGLNGAGFLASNSRGVFGLDGLNIASASESAAQGSVISSASRSVHLDSGTRMLLTAGNTAGEVSSAPQGAGSAMSPAASAAGSGSGAAQANAGKKAIAQNPSNGPTP